MKKLRFIATILFITIAFTSCNRYSVKDCVECLNNNYENKVKVTDVVINKQQQLEHFYVATFSCIIEFTDSCYADDAVPLYYRKGDRFELNGADLVMPNYVEGNTDNGKLICGMNIQKYGVYITLSGEKMPYDSYIKMIRKLEFNQETEHE